MADNTRVDVGCLLVGEYSDEGEVLANGAPSAGEVVRPQIVANYLDLWDQSGGSKDFTILLKDGRVVVVRGHSLKLLPPTIAGDTVSYAVVVRAADKEVLVALFKAVEVVGICHGELRADRKIA